METLPVAVLFTECGPLQIFCTQALCEVIASLQKDAQHAHKVGASPVLAPTAPVTTDVVENWNAGQWCEWGRKKSALASKLCKLNGTLKAHVAELECKISKLYGSIAARQSTHDGIDPLVLNDPWETCPKFELNPRVRSDKMITPRSHFGSTPGLPLERVTSGQAVNAYSEFDDQLSMMVSAETITRCQACFRGWSSRRRVREMRALREEDGRRSVTLKDFENMFSHFQRAFETKHAV